MLTNISLKNAAILNSPHPVLILAISKSNETISNIIEVYLQVFDPILLSEETCSKSLRSEAWRYLRKMSEDGFFCLDQLNAQILATSRNQQVKTTVHQIQPNYSKGIELIFWNKQCSLFFD